MFQHVTENDFIIRLLGGTIEDLAEDMDTSTSSRRRTRRLQQTGGPAEEREEEGEEVELGVRDGEGRMPLRYAGKA